MPIEDFDVTLRKQELKTGLQNLVIFIEIAYQDYLFHAATPLLVLYQALPASRTCTYPDENTMIPPR